MNSKVLAEAIFLVIKRILKWIVIAILFFVVISLLIFGYNEFDNWYSIERHKAKVEMVVRFDSQMCKDKSHPLFIGVINNSPKTIVKTTSYITVTNTGYSSKLNEYDGIISDKIVKPTEGWGSCWSVIPKDGKTIINGKNMEVKLDNFYIELE
jgi:hypothetical protein